MKERWKVIPDYEKYSVSSEGRVKNNQTNRVLKPTVDYSKGYSVVNLYDSNSRPSTKGVHTLVAKAFIPNPENKRLVNHKDTNKTNNVVSNLEWATDSENMKHAFQHGLCENTRLAAKKNILIANSLPKTERQREISRQNIIRTNKRPKTEKQLEIARQSINSPLCRKRAAEARMDRHPPIKVVETGKVYRSQRELSTDLGINESAVCACLHGRRSHVNGYHFEYVKE